MSLHRKIPFAPNLVEADNFFYCYLFSTWNLRKTGQTAPGLFMKSNHSSLLISATVDAFRGHGFSLLVTKNMCSCGYSSQSRLLLRLLVAKILALGQHLSCGVFSSCTCRFAYGAEKHLLFPQKSPPALQSTNIDGNYDYRLV